MQFIFFFFLSKVSFVKKKKSAGTPKASFERGNLCYVTSRDLACNKGHQTNTIFLYVTTGNVTHYLSGMSNYSKTRGQ